MKDVNVIVGLGYGDEGKGRTVDHFAQENPNSVVVRFNGGPQAGHTVSKGAYKHIFASFGSGTLQGCSTYWSSFCPFHPVWFMNEFNALKKMGYRSPYFISKEAPLITRFDVLYNKALELSRDAKHGSCGMGIGATIERHENNYKVFIRDLLTPSILMEKLELVEAYYNTKLTGLIKKLYLQIYDQESSFFYKQALEQVKDLVIMVDEGEFLTNGRDNDFIFEGAQGIMLDMDYGFFPHVTRSNTTSKNALKLIRDYNLGNPVINYVTRCYSTRHGAGPLIGESSDFKKTLQNTEDETNIEGDWQGKLRYAPLDFNTLNYAVACDQNFSKMHENNLIITCLDQLKTRAVPCIIEGRQSMVPVHDISSYLDIEGWMGSASPLSESEFVTKW